MMVVARTAECPEKAVIIGFSHGTLDPTTADTVSTHLETCADCRLAVDRVPPDSFIGRLRAAHKADDGPPASASDSSACA